VVRSEILFTMRGAGGSVFDAIWLMQFRCCVTAKLREQRADEAGGGHHAGRIDLVVRSINPGAERRHRRKTLFARAPPPCFAFRSTDVLITFELGKRTPWNSFSVAITRCLSQGCRNLKEVSRHCR